MGSSIGKDAGKEIAQAVDRSGEDLSEAIHTAAETVGSKHSAAVEKAAETMGNKHSAALQQASETVGDVLKVAATGFILLEGGKVSIMYKMVTALGDKLAYPSERARILILKSCILGVLNDPGNVDRQVILLVDDNFSANVLRGELIRSKVDPLPVFFTVQQMLAEACFPDISRTKPALLYVLTRADTLIIEKLWLPELKVPSQVRSWIVECSEGFKQHQLWISDFQATADVVTRNVKFGKQPVDALHWAVEASAVYWFLARFVELSIGAQIPSLLDGVRFGAVGDQIQKFMPRHSGNMCAVAATVFISVKTFNMIYRNGVTRPVQKPFIY